MHDRINIIHPTSSTSYHPPSSSTPHHPPAPSGNGGLFSASRDGCVRHWVSRGAALECRSTYPVEQKENIFMRILRVEL